MTENLYRKDSRPNPALGHEAAGVIMFQDQYDMVVPKNLEMDPGP